MTDEQSAPLNAKEALGKFELVIRNGAGVQAPNYLAARRAVLATLDAARERPSTLDVGSLSDFMAFVEREAGGLPYNLDHWLRLYFARLTEPDAGNAASTPDTTEALLRAALERLVNSVQDLETVDDDGEAATFLVVPPEPLERARAALQQPAVQPEGGPE